MDAPNRPNYVCLDAPDRPWQTVCSTTNVCVFSVATPGPPRGLFGAAEGISYLYVTGLVAWSAVTKVKTGGGLPEGPGGVLGLAEAGPSLTACS